MFQYVSKFLIQILPSVTATVIGGFIVHTWIMPKASPDQPRPAIVSKASAETGEADRTADAKPESKPANVKGIAMSKDVGSKDTPQKDMSQKDTASAKPDDAKLRGSSDTPSPTSDTRHAAKPASPEKPASTANEKPKAASSAAATPDVTAAVTPPADDRRNASELARTALERLRAGEQPRNDQARAAEQTKTEGRVSEPARSQPLPVTEPVHAVAEPQPASMPMGPPINIRAPRYSEAVIGEDARGDETRMVPPGEIPTVHRASDASDGRTTIADDFVSATRSMLRAVLPK